MGSWKSPLRTLLCSWVLEESHGFDFIGDYRLTAFFCGRESIPVCFRATLSRDIISMVGEVVHVGLMGTA